MALPLLLLGAGFGALNWWQERQAEKEEEALESPPPPPYTPPATFTAPMTPAPVVPTIRPPAPPMRNVEPTRAQPPPARPQPSLPVQVMPPAPTTPSPGQGASTAAPSLIVPATQLKDRGRLDAAAAFAKLVQTNLKAKGKDYDKQLMKRFQETAGLKDVDGIYGPKSAGALKWYVNDEIKPHVGTGFAAYFPPF